jgi:hypothetical protein
MEVLEYVSEIVGVLLQRDQKEHEDEASHVSSE